MINIKTTTRLLSYQKKQLSWLFFMLYAFFCALNSSAEVFFSQDCKKNIIDLINNSEKEIHIAVYSIDDPDITESLFKFVEKGGKLQVITDRVQAAGRQSRSPDIYNKINPNFKINSKRFRIMHDKFAIFDLKKTVNGSFNWTYSAANKNAEDCKISNEEQDIERFYEKFKDMWDSFSNEETDYFFKKLALKKEIKLKLEKQEKEGSLYDELPSYKMNRFESNKLKFCIKLCRNKCTKQEIIRREVFQLEKNQKQQNNDEGVGSIGIEGGFDNRQQNSLTGCKKKCHNKCLKKILIQKELAKSMNNAAALPNEQEHQEKKKKINGNFKYNQNQRFKKNHNLIARKKFKKTISNKALKPEESLEAEDDSETLSRSATETGTRKTKHNKPHNSQVYKSKKFKKWKHRKRFAKNLTQDEPTNEQLQ